MCVLTADPGVVLARVLYSFTSEVSQVYARSRARASLVQSPWYRSQEPLFAEPRRAVRQWRHGVTATLDLGHRED
jgi:hypothetical protein